MSSDALLEAIARLSQRVNLTRDESEGAFNVIMSGNATAAQMAAILMGLRVKGETAEEVAGAVRSLRNVMVRLELPDANILVDTCGTGGGEVTTFNISTGAAILAAGAGVRIAKHGNRSFTSRSGSADVLEALGVNISLSAEEMPSVLSEAGIVFMFAPLMHPAMRHVGPVRRELAIPTIMNIVGPLANPAGVLRQVVGVADEGRAALLSNALLSLGSRRAMVVHGEVGVDEISPVGRTVVLEIRDGKVHEWSIDPRALGISGVSVSELRGGEPAENAEIITEVLSGRGSAGARAAVLLNAAAAILVADMAPSFSTAYALAERALDEGAGLAALERMRRTVPVRGG